MHARAYTTGSGIVFGADEYHPDREDGRRLIAHELAHVAQQDRAQPGSSGSMTVEHDAWEQDASRMAHDVLGSNAGPVISQAPQSAAPAIMREPDDQSEPKEELKPYRIPGTPLTVIPLEQARPGESINLFGIRLPYRAVRLTNENQITPLPAIPRHWRDLSNMSPAQARFPEDAGRRAIHGT